MIGTNLMNSIMTKKYLLIQLLWCMMIFTSCGPKSTEEVKQFLKKEYCSEHPDLTFCDISSEGGILTKAQITNMVYSYEKYYDVINSKKIGDKIIEVAKKERKRALEIIERATFQEYDTYYLKLLKPSAPSDTIRITATCKHGTCKDVRFFEDGSEYDMFESELDPEYHTAIEAAKRFMGFVINAHSYLENMESGNDLLALINLAQIKKFIDENY